MPALPTTCGTKGIGFIPNTAASAALPLDGAPIDFITHSLWPPAVSRPANVGMDVQKRVGINLQRLRRHKRLSQEALAHAADVHQTYLSGVESGKRNPSVRVLERIVTALGVDIEELFRRVKRETIRR
jgi:DNA-binding XRE family transcriptional regulator